MNIPRLRDVFELHLKQKVTLPMNIVAFCLIFFLLMTSLGAFLQEVKKIENAILAFFILSLLICYLIIQVTLYILKHKKQFIWSRVALQAYSPFLLKIKDVGFIHSSDILRKYLSQFQFKLPSQILLFGVFDEGLFLYAWYLDQLADKIYPIGKVEIVRERLNVIQKHIDSNSLSSHLGYHPDDLHVELLKLQQQLKFMEEIHSTALLVSQELEGFLQDAKQSLSLPYDEDASSWLLLQHIAREKRLQEMCKICLVSENEF